jgi:hypothetical protein
MNQREQHSLAIALYELADDIRAGRMDGVAERLDCIGDTLDVIAAGELECVALKALTWDKTVYSS